MAMSSARAATDISAFNPEQLANAILRESRELFVSIPIPEDSTPDLARMGPFFSNLSALVQSEILAKKDMTQRVQEMERWIKVLDACYKQGDMNCVSAIVSAFQANPIHRLVTTQEQLPTTSRVLLEEMKRLSPRALNATAEAVVPAASIVSGSFELTRNKIKDTLGRIKEAEEKKASTDSLVTSLTATRESLKGLVDYVATKQATARQATIEPGPAELFIRKLRLSHPTMEDKKQEAEFTRKRESDLLDVAETIEKKGDNLAMVAVRGILNQAATGGLQSLLDDILKSETLRGKIKPEAIDASFMSKLNVIIINPHPDKSVLTALLATAGIALDDKNYERIRKQAGYRAQLPEDLKSMIGNQYIKGEPSGIIRTTDTGKKVRELSKCFEECHKKSLDDAQQDFARVLKNVGLTIAPEKIAALWQERRLSNGLSVSPGTPGSR